MAITSASTPRVTLLAQVLALSQLPSATITVFVTSVTGSVSNTVVSLWVFTRYNAPSSTATPLSSYSSSSSLSGGVLTSSSSSSSGGAAVTVGSNAILLYPTPQYDPSTAFVASVQNQSLSVWQLQGNHQTAFVLNTGAAAVLNVTWLAGTVTQFQINPLSLGLTATQVGNSLLIPLTGPVKFEVELNNVTYQLTQQNQLLYVFVDGPETQVPSPNDPTVYYYPAGNWTVPNNTLSILPGDTHVALYLAPGARLNARLYVHTSTPF